MPDPAQALTRRDGAAPAAATAAPGEPPRPHAPVSGFDAVEAAWRLLRRHGHEGGLQAFRDAQAQRGRGESLAEPLERAGIQARPALIEAEEVAYLDVPTLLQLADGSWVLLTAHQRGTLEVEGVEGACEVELDDLAPFLSGYALDLSPSLPAGKGLWGRLLALVLHHRRTLATLALATALLQLLALVVPEITAVVMNTALPDRARSTLHVVAVGVVLVTAFQAWMGWLRERILLFLVTRIAVSAERGLLQHMLRLPFPFLDKLTLGERLQAITGMNGAREVLAERSVAAVLDGGMALVLVVSMVTKMPAATLVVVGVAFLMAGLAVVVGSAQAKHQAREVEAQARERGYLSELIAGIGTVKAAGAEEQGLQRWVQRFGGELKHALRRQRLGLWSDVGLDVLRQGLYVALLIWGGSLILDGKLLVGTLFAFVQLSSGFLSAVFGFVRTYLALVVLRPQLVKTKQVLARTPDARTTRRATAAPSVPVVMEDVWFRYGPESPWIAKGYSVRFEAGTKQVITGPSGFGKSTILRLLAGLYVPEEGTISIGGSSPHAAARDILYLPQFVNLFSGSIIENLTLLSGGAPVARLFEVAQATGLAELVATWPMKYHTVLSPGGRSISGGQRQLIVLTAALAADRKLLLLDEALSNIDPVRAVALRRLLDAVPATIIEARHVVA
jgi:ABC-type bacteriocin/lantibiotic exporter with double-glycine peptidase domain